MKATVKQPDLKTALGLAVAAVERKITIPALGMVRLTAKGEKLTLTTTDLEVSCRVSLPAKVRDEGEQSAPAHHLYQIVKALLPGEILFEPAKDRLRVRCEHSDFRLPSVPIDTMPKIDSLDSEPVSLPGRQLATALEKVSIAISREESRYTLNAALITEGEVVATDGHRLALVKAPWANLKRLLMPGRAIHLLGKFLADESVAFRQDDSHMSFRGENWELTCRKISGEFPNYKAVLPKAEECKIYTSFLAKDMIPAVERSLIVSDSRSRAIKLSLKPKGLTVSAHSPEYGEAEEELPFECQGEIEVGFNGDYLLAFLGKLGGHELVRAYFKDDQSSALLLAEGDKFSYVIMPMRL